MIETKVRVAQNSKDIEMLYSAHKLESVKELLREKCKCTFKANDKRNAYFNDLELTSEGEFVYKRLFLAQGDLNFEDDLIKEIIKILCERPLALSEKEAIENKKFQKTWILQSRAIFRLLKRRNLFEIGISRYYL